MLIIAYSILYVKTIRKKIFEVFFMLGDRLKEARKAKKKTQAEMASIVGVSQATYSCYERGTITPEITSVVKFSEALGVTTDYLCGLSDNPQGTSDRPILDATCEAIIAKLMGAPDDVVREAMDYVEYLTAKAERRMRQERREKRDSLKRMADNVDAEKGEP
jgi:transcriptional regulator with XRE-family HTH domain